MLRVPLLVAALVAVSAAGAPLARAASVTITPAGGGAPKTLDLDALKGSFDVHEATYALRAADGSTSSVTVADGISLGALLRAAGLDGDPFTYVEIPRPDGSSSTYVLADHVGDAGHGVPVVWPDAQGVHFLRPSDGPGDANADDNLTFPNGTLALDLHTGELLEPRVEVSTLIPRPHETVRFSASLAAGTLAPGMRFQWYFDGGPYVYGVTVSHRFATSGPYKIQLNVVRGSESVTNLPTIVHVRVVASQPRRRAAAAQGAVTGASSANGATGGGTGAGGGAAPGSAPGKTTVAMSRPLPSAGAPVRAAPPLDAPQGRLVSGTLIAAA
ncbi:MAG TPA: PKD domain-containing protein, partial [Conexibacter sp.]|nr:PKD domain-containing protein [Conexibacter sp.]